MNDIEGIKYYSPIEESINIISHAIGLVLSIVALVLLVRHANLHGNGWHVASFAIFGLSLISLYAASTFYHSAKKTGFKTSFTNRRPRDHLYSHCRNLHSLCAYYAERPKRLDAVWSFLGHGFNRHYFKTVSYRKI